MAGGELYAREEDSNNQIIDPDFSAGQETSLG